MEPKVEWNPEGGTNEYFNDRVWHAPDMMSSEIETGDFLWGLIRLVKPKLVLETGCYKGETSLRIADAIKRNGSGKFVTCDTDEQMVQDLRERFSGWPIDLGSAEVHQCKGVDLIAMYPSPDIAFIDAGDDKNRLAEAQALRMKPGSFVLLHDARRKAFNEILVWYHHWNLVFFSTPRGLAMWQT